MRKSQYVTSELNVLVSRENIRKKSMRMSIYKWKAESKSVLTKLKITCRKNFIDKYNKNSYEIYCISIINGILQNKLSRATCHFKDTLIYNEPEELLISYSYRDLKCHYEDLKDKNISFKVFPNYLGLSQSVQNILFTNISLKQNLIDKIYYAKKEKNKVENILSLNSNNDFKLDSDFYKLLEEKDEIKEDKIISWHHPDKADNSQKYIKENSLDSIEMLIDKLDDVLKDVRIIPSEEKNENKGEEIEVVNNNCVKRESVLFKTSSDVKSCKNYKIESINRTDNFISFASETKFDRNRVKDNSIEGALNKRIKFIGNDVFLKNIRKKEKENKNRIKLIQTINERNRIIYHNKEINEMESPKFKFHKTNLYSLLPKIKSKSKINSINQSGKLKTESKIFYNSAKNKNNTDLDSDLNILISEFQFYTPVKDINLVKEKVNSVCNLIYSNKTNQFYLGATKNISRNFNYK